MSRQSYTDKLRDPRWQKKRLWILSRANFTCEMCGDDESELHVHHCYYEFGREPWEYNSDTLMACCPPCHKVRQKVEQTAKLAFSKILRLKTNIADLVELTASMKRVNDAGETIEITP